MDFNITKLLIIMLCTAAFSYFLWQKGLMVISAKSAVAFVGHRRKNSWGASVTACTGYTKRTLMLTAGRQYRFSLELSTDSGNVSVLLSKDRQPMFVFDKDGETHTFTADNGLYIITTSFKTASGQYKLFWEKI